MHGTRIPAWRAESHKVSSLFATFQPVIQDVTFEIHPDLVSKCVAFYALIGFREVQPPPSLADRAAWLQSGPTQVNILHGEERVTLPRGHVAVVADTFDALVGRLERAGSEV